MLTWVLAFILLVAAVVLTVSHIKEQARFKSEREYSKRLREKAKQGKPVSESVFDAEGNRVDSVEDLEEDDDR